MRRQVTDLTLDDLRETPVWEFAIDEEGEPGQDEETDSGLVNFWRGMVFDESKLEATIAGSYDALRTSPAELFPLRWERAVDVKGGPSKGELRGFGYLREVGGSSWSEEWKT